MTIHTGHPFAEPRDPVRAFRGRLASGVTLWTANGRRSPVGLTVTSLLVANGEPARMVALLDPLADLTEVLAESGRAAVTLLGSEHRYLAEVFGGVAPAPGGQFRTAEFEQTEWGPVPVPNLGWVGVRLDQATDLGWFQLVTAVIETVVEGAREDPLIHYRGDYPGLR